MIYFFILRVLSVTILIKNIDGFLATIVLADNFRGITEESFLSVFGVAVICITITLSTVRGEGAII